MAFSSTKNLKWCNYTDVEQILNSTAVRSRYEAHGVCKNDQLFGESDDEN